MKIYFSGSIRGGREDADIYRQIIDYLQNFGQVLTEHIGDSSLDSSGESKIDDQKIHDRDIELLLESDIIIAEVKQERMSRSSDFMRIAKEMSILPMRLSKYCLSTMQLEPHLKKNRFKGKLLFINKLKLQ